MTSILAHKGPRAINRALIAAFIAISGLGVTPALAAPGGSYVATLAAPLAAPQQEIIGGVLWKCAGDRCAAPAEGGRHVMVCTRLARKVGAISRFAVPQGELPAEELARCNAAK